MQALVNRKDDEMVVVAASTFSQLEFVHNALANSPATRAMMNSDAVSRINSVAGPYERQIALAKGAGMQYVETTKMFGRGIHIDVLLMILIVLGYMGAVSELKQVAGRGARTLGSRARVVVSLRAGEYQRTIRQLEAQIEDLKKDKSKSELIVNRIAVLEEQKRMIEALQTDLLAALALPPDQPRPCVNYLINRSFIGGEQTPMYCDAACGCSTGIINAPTPRANELADHYDNAMVAARTVVVQQRGNSIGGGAMLAPRSVLQRIARRCAAAGCWLLDERDVQGYNAVRAVFTLASTNVAALPASSTLKATTFRAPRSNIALSRLKRQLDASQVRSVCQCLMLTLL
jgi:hypothetical protein